MRMAGLCQFYWRTCWFCFIDGWYSSAILVCSILIEHNIAHCISCYDNGLCTLSDCLICSSASDWSASDCLHVYTPCVWRHFNKQTDQWFSHTLPPLSHYTLSFLSVILFPRKHAFNKHLVVTAERCLTARDAVTLTSCVTCFYIFIVYLSLHVWPVMSWSVDPTQHSSVLFHLMHSQWLIAASLSNHHLNKCYRRFTRQWWCCRHTTET